MKKITVVHLIILVALVMLTGCEKLITGMGPQPSIIDKTEYEARLNVLGVLRPDTLQGLPATFVHVEKTVNWDNTDSTEVWDVLVNVIEYDNGVAVDTFQMKYGNFGDVHADSYYRNRQFYAQGGRTYGLLCSKEGFPELKAITTIPVLPVIVQGSWELGNGALSFDIRRDESAVIYDLVFEAAGQRFEERVRRPETGDIHISLDLPARMNIDVVLTIYAYDEYLSEYLSYNVSIKPNTYIAQYSTVENGFGCFGSLNLLKRSFVY
ncbi:hypothetical protein KAR48_20210 [bacterium]|nr:hypothetical protein [bacterium]